MHFHFLYKSNLYGNFFWKRFREYIYRIHCSQTLSQGLLQDSGENVLISSDKILGFERIQRKTLNVSFISGVKSKVDTSKFQVLFKSTFQPKSKGLFL